MIITVGAEKGGVGKSRVATHIAAIAASKGVDVILLDADLQGSSVSWVALRKDNKVEPDVSVLALPPQPAKELANLSSKYSLIVVDIAAQSYKTMMECAALSDLVLVPCGNDQQEMESTQRVFNSLAQVASSVRPGLPIPAYVLLNRMPTQEHARATQELRQVFAEDQIPVFNSQLAYRAAWIVSGKTGRTVFELQSKDRSEKACEEMNAVYKEILKRVKEK